MRKSLSTKLMYSFMALIATIVIGVTIGMSFLITDYFFEEKEKELYQKGREVAITVDYFMRIESDSRLLNRYLSSMDRLVGARIWLFDNDYELVAASNSGIVLGPEADDAADFSKLKQEIYEYDDKTGTNAENGKKQPGPMMQKMKSVLANVYEGKPVNSRIFHPYYKEQVLLIGVPIGNLGGSLDGAMLMAAPISGLDKFLKDIYIYTALVGLAALLLSLFIVRRLSKTIVKPLVSMRDSASAIAAGDYSRKVTVEGEDEIAELGSSLNALGNDLSQFVRKTQKMEKLRRDFVANVSHELRTPITIIRGYNEAISDGTVTDDAIVKKYRSLINEETIRLERLIKELLDISRLQISEKAEPEIIPIGNIVRNVAEMLTVRAAERRITIVTEVDDSLNVRGAGDRLVQLAMILGDNAIKYSPDNGVIKFEVYLNEEKDKVVLAVEDQGHGIPEEDIPFIWERFYKVDKSHSRNVPGTGLGLAIAKEIIRMHGAGVVVRSKQCEGTRFEISFNNNAEKQEK